MRFLSSSALASAPKLRFDASCSAAETMARRSELSPRDPTMPHAWASSIRNVLHVGHRHREVHGPQMPAYAGSASLAGARIATDPPAFSTAATADLEAPHTENAT